MKKKPVLVDLSHSIENGLITYKGLPAPVICDYLSREASKNYYEDGTQFQIGKIEMVANTGTYLDSPFHRYEDGKDLSELSLSALVELQGQVIRVPHQKKLAITEKDLEGLTAGADAVLIHTGWDVHWKSDAYFENHPFLTEGAALFLKNAGVRLVGIDSHNIDNTMGNSRPVHSILLAAEILIVEHMCNLAALPDKEFKFSAVPPKFRGVGTFPVRAIASYEPN